MPDPHDALAAELRALAAYLDVPEAADPRAAVRARLTGEPAVNGATGPVRRLRGRLTHLPVPSRPSWLRPARSRRWVFALLAAILAATAVVAPARAAVVDAVDGLLRIAGIEVRLGPEPGALPTRPAPLPSTGPVTLAEARRAAPFPIGVPAELGPPERVLIADPDPAGAPRVVTLLYRGDTVRLDEFDGGLDPGFFKSARDAQWIQVGAADGIWVPTSHPVTYVGRDGVRRTETARLAGPTLIWSDGTAAYRLEGLTDFEQARTVALSLE